MPRINIVLRSGEMRTLTASSGQSVRELLISGGVDEIAALSNCGGCCSCGTCHVYIAEADFPRLPSMGTAETDLLEVLDNRRPTSRLSCQVLMSDELDGLSIVIAPD